MLIKNSISGNKHLDVGNIKIAFTIVCKDDWFRDVYFNCNSIYIVKSGKAILKSKTNTLELKKGEVALIKQHSILDIRKFKDENGSDFQSFIFQLFPDFVSECIEKNEVSNIPEDKIQNDMMYGDKASKAILSNLSYQFFGKVNDPDTAKYHERFLNL